MLESQFWIQVKSHMPIGAHFVRVENATTSGVPDVNACLNGVEAWLELKVRRARYDVVRGTQIAWISKRVKAGGRVFILIKDYKTGAMELYSGADAIGVNDGAARPLVTSTASKNGRFDWSKIWSIVFFNKMDGNSDIALL